VIARTRSVIAAELSECDKTSAIDITPQLSAHYAAGGNSPFSF